MTGVERDPTFVMTNLVSLIHSVGRTRKHMRTHVLVALDCRDKPGNDECGRGYEEVGMPHV